MKIWLYFCFRKLLCVFELCWSLVLRIVNPIYCFVSVFVWCLIILGRLCCTHQLAGFRWGKPKLKWSSGAERPWSWSGFVLWIWWFIGKWCRPLLLVVAFGRDWKKVISRWDYSDVLEYLCQISVPCCVCATPEPFELSGLSGLSVLNEE